MNKTSTNIKTIITRTLVALSLTLGGLAAAQSPLAFQSVAHIGGDMSLAINNTWAAFSGRGYSGTVTEMTANSVGYRFSQGDKTIDITVRQTTDGVLVITKDPNAVILAGK